MNNNNNHPHGSSSSSPGEANSSSGVQNKRNNVKTRIKTVTVAIPVFVLSCLYSPMAMRLVVGTLVFFGLLEYINLAYSLTYHIPKPEGLYTRLDYFLLIWSMLTMYSTSFGYQAFNLCTYIFLFTLFTYQVLTYNGAETKMQTHQLALYFLGYMYIVWTLCHCLFFLDSPNGPGCCMLLMVCTWASDAGAFFVGSSIGRHKMLPNVSPNKSWEGITAGLLGSFLMAIVAYILKGITFLKLPNYNFEAYLVIGIMLGVLGLIGDLCESFIKRTANIKDSGSFFPGHGGVLDRIDSLFFASPFLYYFEYFVLS